MDVDDDDAFLYGDEPETAPSGGQVKNEQISVPVKAEPSESTFQGHRSLPVPPIEGVPSWQGVKNNKTSVGLCVNGGD
jgi:hypothetical protein